MKWYQSKWGILFSFLLGCLVCYLSLNISLFDIKREIDVQGFLISIIGFVVALIIADTIQRKINKSQKKYSFVIDKLDRSWSLFTKFSSIIILDDKITLNTTVSFSKEISQDIIYLKSIFDGYKINIHCLETLSDNIDKLDSIFDDLRTEENIKYFGDKKPILEELIQDINTNFSKVLDIVENL